MDHCKVCTALLPAPEREKGGGRKREFCDDACRQKHHRMKKCGLTPEQYREYIQWGCELCGKTTDLCIDHDHTRESFRGILCNSCNLKLGDIEVLARLVLSHCQGQEKSAPIIRRKAVLQIDYRFAATAIAYLMRGGLSQ